MTMSSDGEDDGIGAVTTRGGSMGANAGRDEDEDDDDDDQGRAQGTGGWMRGTGRGVASAGGVVASAAAAALASGGLETWDPQTWAIAGLFLIAGVGLPIETVREAASNWRLNAFTQAFVFGFPPVVVASAASTLVQSGWLDETVVSGVFIMACLPTTVGSGVAFTRSADGNVSAALLNSVAANLAGIFLTPALVHAYLGADSAVDPVASSSKLVAQAVLPTLVGMSMRLLPGVAAAADGALKEPSKLLSDAILLAIVVKTFVTAEQSEAGALDWTTGAHLLGFLALFMLAHKSAIWLAASSVEGFSRRDRVAALYMGSHKTLAFGVPLITTTFENDPNLTSYLLPLVAYHPALVAVSAALVAPLRAYVAEGENP